MRSRISESRVVPTALDVRADRAAIEYMAFNGHSARLHAVFRSLDADERRRLATPEVLRQVFVGGMAHLRALPLDAARQRREQMRFLDAVVEWHGAACERDGASRRDYFGSALEWSGALFAEARLAEAEALCGRALEGGAIDFPALYPRFVLLRAAMRCARGDVLAADADLQGLYARRDLISDWKVLPEVVLALGRTALLSGRYGAFQRLLFDGLRSFFPGLDERRAMVDLLRSAYPRGRWLLGGPPARDKAWLAAHWAFFALHRRAGPARRVLGRAFLGAIYLTRYGLPRRRRPGSRTAPGPVLVTRAMGGVGDLLMMTPGLRALRQRTGMPVDLAVPRRYFPVFDGNDDVRLLDVRDPVDHEGYARWHNLTECPAARVESRTAPRVRRNRIELFAHAMGIRGQALRRLDRRPRYVLTDSDRERQRLFFASHGLAGRQVVAVQLASDEPYRDYLHMAALVRRLAREWPVLAFAPRRPSGFDGGDALLVEGLPLREAFAIAGGCDAMVAPDSAFVHLSAALAIPCVALFGPTDGRVRTADYPLCRVLDARRSLRCIPCWRNDDIPCHLTGMKASVCLGAVETASVRDALQELLASRAARAKAC